MSPYDLDDFLSSSQQASELRSLENDVFILASPSSEIVEAKRRRSGRAYALNAPDIRPESSSSSPRRCFTPTGDRARIAFALHLSLRTAALEEIQRRYHSQDGEVYHLSLPYQEPTGSGASKESYGGNWADVLALKLLDGGLHPAGDDSDLPR